MRVTWIGSIELVRGGVRGHSHARAWPGCDVVCGFGEAVTTFSQIVDEDLSPLVR
ncbi:MAG TPA: hypothetical protein VHN36_12690 [Ilumatobacteraceae bacterium]|nr:hypothetical protein [Ilumatobacteraceae bacterium]